MKQTLWHTHFNEKWLTNARTEPQLVIVPGWSCKDCQRRSSHPDAINRHSTERHESALHPSKSCSLEPH